MRSIRRVRSTAVLPVLAIVALGALAGRCVAEESAAPRHRPGLAQQGNALALRHAIVATYALQRDAEYRAIVAACVDLRDAITALTSAPDAATLEAARLAWRRARALYAPSECHRYSGGPIDEPRADRENRINAWPIDERWIDAVDGEPDAGIVNRVAEFPVIDGALLRSLNRRGGEKNVATGFHAIEFLLWGQGEHARGPGVRGADDYRLGVGTNADRRRAYLVACVDLLIDDLGAVADAWRPDVPGDYADGFVRDDARGLRAILTGLAALSGDELACERMAVAYESRSLEDGQSCFSFTTLDDLVGNIDGIRATYLGRGPGPAGPGPGDLVRGVAPEIDARIRSQLDLACARMRAIPAPFAAAIQGDDAGPGRTAVLAAITALEPLRLLLMDAATRCGVGFAMGKDPDRALKQAEPLNANE